MRKMRKQKILLALVAMSVTLAGAGIAYNNTLVNADAAADAYFTMTDGASIKLSDKGCGIRWETKVTNSYIQTLDAKADTTVTVGTVVYPAGTTLTYDMAGANIYEFDLASLTQDAEGVYTYLATVTYDNAEFTSEEQRKQSYKVELDARSYIKYTTSEGTETVSYMPNAADSVRTMEGVANQAAIIDATLPEDHKDKLTSAELTLLANYVNDAATTTIEQSLGYCVKGENNDYTVADVADGTYNVYVNAKQVGKNVAVSSGAFSVENVAVPKDGEYDVSLIGESKIYRAKATVVSAKKTVDMFSAVDGEAYGTTNVATLLSGYFGEAEITATQGETTLTYADSKLTGVVPTLVKNGGYTTGIENVEVVATANDKIVVLDLQAYTKVLTSKEDLNYFNVKFTSVAANTACEDCPKSNNASKHYHAVAENKKRDGYYILGNNIDAAGFTVSEHPNTAGLGSSTSGATIYYTADDGTIKNRNVKDYDGFLGTFDGNGYAIQNATFAYGGLFGLIGDGATIKNLAVTEAKFTGSSYASVFAARIFNNVQFKNIYIQAEKLGTNSANGALLATAMVESVGIENCVFVLGDDGDNGKSKAHGVLLQERVPEADVTTWKNTFVISPVLLYNKNATSSNVIIDGANQTTTGATVTLNGVMRYNNAEAWSAEENNEYLTKRTTMVATFNTEFWDTSSGVPVWREKA